MTEQHQIIKIDSRYCSEYDYFRLLYAKWENLIVGSDEPLTTVNWKEKLQRVYRLKKACFCLAPVLERQKGRLKQQNNI